jgi:hypothetical protein
MHHLTWNFVLLCYHNEKRSSHNRHWFLEWRDSECYLHDNNVTKSYTVTFFPGLFILISGAQQVRLNPSSLPVYRLLYFLHFPIHANFIVMWTQFNICNETQLSELYFTISYFTLLWFNHLNLIFLLSIMQLYLCRTSIIPSCLSHQN